MNVDYRGLREKTKRMAQICTELSAQICRISEYVQNLDIFWDGDANDAYKLKISEDLVTMGTDARRACNTVKIMRSVLDIYMRNEKEVKRRLKI